MEEKLLKRAAISSVLFMIVIFVLSTSISILNEMNISAENSINKTDKTNYIDSKNMNENIDPIVEHKDELEESIDSVIGSKYISIELGQEYKGIKLDELYMERKIIITIEGIDYGDINTHNIIRANNGEEFKTSILFENIDDKFSFVTLPINSQESLDQVSYVETISQNNWVDSKEYLDPVTMYSIEYLKNDNNTYKGIITFDLDTIYLPTLHQKDGYLYISLEKPSDVYETIVVIDAGHGGKDPGTHSVDMSYFEKDINLDILLYLQDRLDNENFKVYYTRSIDETVYLNPRVDFANEVEADLFLSIHCNASESTKAYGSEVLYNENHSSNILSSKEFANICLDEILSVTNRVNRGLVEASEMVIVGEANMPVALIEIGFMTNQEDLEFLLNENNKISIADALYRSIIQGIELLSSSN